MDLPQWVNREASFPQIVVRGDNFILPCSHLSGKMAVHVWFFDVLVAALAEREPFALGIISGIKDRVPRRKGRRLCFLPMDAFTERWAGVAFEAEVRDRARRAS